MTNYLKMSGFFLFLLLMGCGSIQRSALKKEIKTLEKRFQSHSGFVLYDDEQQKTVFSYNADKYFTPASNTKIFTFYVSLKTLGDSIPALSYYQSEDSLIFWGTGNPSFLYLDTLDQHVFEFLKNSPGTLYYSPANYQSQHFGAGWAWDDYPYAFSAEKSPFPIYGNCITLSKAAGDQTLEINSPVFKQYFWLGDSTQASRTLSRAYETTDLTYYPTRTAKGFEKRMPFRYNHEDFTALLADTLNRAVYWADIPLRKGIGKIYGAPTDSLYKKMMQDSDNFIAEQLLMACGNELFNTLDTKKAIEQLSAKHLFDLPDKPIWKDGSGLSRYNLFTPRSIVALWQKIYKETGKERLFSLLATGGKSGTLKNWYIEKKPYIYGKTGTLSNNHCLSGFLVSKKGKTFIFSFMNNNYITSSSAIKKEMEQILYEVYINN